jgi:organic hydroperoxide reductase OsmC/OhrA
MTKTSLEELGEPLYFIAANAADAGFPTPPNPLGQSVRTWVRSLEGMQKEALVVSAATGMAWRVASDEGPHLGGHNQAPNPLTFLSTGMIASYMNEITALAQQRGMTLKNLELVLNNYYFREGDFRKGTMNSGVLPPELEVRCEASRDDQTLNTMLFEAVSASPLNGLASGVHPSLFTLVHNGNVLTPEQVTPLKADPFADPGDNFPNLERATETNAVPGLIKQLVAEDAARAAFNANPPNSPKIDDDKILLHMHTKCVLRSDGVKEIFKEQFSPAAPTWKFLSDEADGFGGKGRAPDAATLISAGIGLCYMTQVGRFAGMAKLPLTGYRIIQDTHFSLGGASGKTGKAGISQPVETHVYMDSTADDYVAQQILGVAERTCFLHAFCRADVKPKARFTRTSQAA